MARHKLDKDTQTIICRAVQFVVAAGIAMILAAGLVAYFGG